MVETASNMNALGSKLPAFSLIDVVSMKDFQSKNFSMEKGVLVAFICNHCPYVKRIFLPLAEALNEFRRNGLDVVAISSNDIKHYPEDRPEKMKEIALELNFVFPYLYDESQEVARSFDAACTPDFFLYDREGKLYYRGQFDDARPSNTIVSDGKDLRSAVSDLIAKKAPPVQQRPSMGCNIKWMAP